MSTKFNWHSEPLNLTTKIDKDYKISQNVRRFFKYHLGDDFHFNRPFIAWMKANIGKTLKDAIEQFKQAKIA